ncbi:unnamed protein product [Polarella glacialis]|uniref:B box-type domain-containing protein n=1 Tax=Polarella glacialis TaxID=89957 RepID=A0A813GC82_POLGL|nr:unnamed protein product [Polarella glacialis]
MSKAKAKPGMLGNFITKATPWMPWNIVVLKGSDNKVKCGNCKMDDKTQPEIFCETYCVDCKKTLCRFCTVLLHHPTTNFEKHSIEEIIHTSSGGVKIFSPVLLDILLLSAAFFLLSGSGITEDYFGGTSYCPGLSRVRWGLARFDANVFFYYKEPLAQYCDWEDSYWRFFMDTWVRSILTGTDGWILLITSFIRAITFEEFIRIIITPVIAFAYALIAFCVRSFEIYLHRVFYERLEGDEHVVTKWLVKLEQVIKRLSFAENLHIKDAKPPPPPTHRRKRPAEDWAEFARYWLDRRLRLMDHYKLARSVKPRAPLKEFDSMLGYPGESPEVSSTAQVRSPPKRPTRRPRSPQTCPRPGSAVSHGMAVLRISTPPPGATMAVDFEAGTANTTDPVPSPLRLRQRVRSASSLPAGGCNQHRGRWPLTSAARTLKHMPRAARDAWAQEAKNTSEPRPLSPVTYSAAGPPASVPLSGGRSRPAGRKGKDDDEEAARLRRATALCREGFDRKACAALLDSGMLDASPDLVDRMLRSFPLDSAAGPSGLRVQHLLDALTLGYREPLLEQLAEVVQLLARGLAPAEVAAHLAGAGLLALAKPKGGVRPIAIGEVLRRLTGKCLCATVKGDAATFFLLSRVGLACPLGVDAAIHTCRAWAQHAAADTNKGLPKLDFANAFNTVDMATYWNKFACDPLGPLLFALAVQPLTSLLRGFAVNGNKLDLDIFFLDDGVLAGDLRVVSAALQLGQSHCAALGLKLNLGERELILPGATTAEDLESLILQSILVDEDTGASKVGLRGNFELLGAAVGQKEFCESFAASKVAKATKLLDELSKLEDPQVATRLLRNCAGVCKVTHSMRTTPPHLQNSAFGSFDSAVRKAFCSVTSLLPNNNQWGQACRGFWFAGLGLRSAALHAEAAFLASACASRELCHALDPAFSLRANSPSADFGFSLAAYNSKLPESRRLQPQAVAGRRQQALSSALDETGHEARLAEASLVDQATLRSECEEGAKEFWQAAPNVHLGLAIPAAEFVTELRYRLCTVGGSQVFVFAREAGAHPELEKPGLVLPPRPMSGAASLRRPADVFVPCWTDGFPAALDFAMTAPQQQDIVSEAARTSLSAASSYSQAKPDFQGTEAACQAQGLSFLPMVCETSSAWAPEAKAVLRQLAKMAAARSGQNQASLYGLMLQRASVVVRCANARAHMKRT